MQYLLSPPLLLLSELPQICTLWTLRISLLSLFSDLPPSQGGRYVGFGSAPVQKTTNNSGKRHTNLSLHPQKFTHSLWLWIIYSVDYHLLFENFCVQTSLGNSLSCILDVYGKHFILAVWIINELWIFSIILSLLMECQLNLYNSTCSHGDGQW